MRESSLITIILVSILFLVSCSGNSNPVTTSGLTESENDDISNASNPDSNYENVFGAWEVQVDLINETAEILPARNAKAIGNIFDADLSQFLTVSPCANCMRITQVNVDYWENLNLTVSMKHPFDNITTRPDLHGFDVRAIFVMPSNTDHPNVPITMPDGSTVTASYSSLLLNSDGLTSHYDELVTDARYFYGGSDVSGTLNPYLRFFESNQTPEFDPHNPLGHNVMPVGSADYARTAIIDGSVLEEFLTFYIIADVAYGQSAVYSNRPDPQYYVPAFNRTEPWRVEYWLENNGMHWLDETSTAELVVQIFDWQHGYDVDASYPDPANLDGIPESSNIDQIIVSIPGLMNDPITESDPVGGSGTPSDPLEYRVELTNENTVRVGQWGLIAVRDELNGQAAPMGRMPVPETPVGFPYATLDIRDYTMYFAFYANVTGAHELEYFEWGGFESEIKCPMQDLFISASASDPTTTLHPTYYNDPGHKKYQYRWDYDYDGVTFNEDGGGNPSPEISLPDPGRHDVGLRVRTTSVPPQEYIYTLPVYTEGTDYNQTWDQAGDSEYSTGYTGSNSIYANSENFYLVYFAEDDSQRDIFMMIGDYDGNVSIHQVTDTPEPCYDPSIVYANWVSSNEVYVVYTQYDGAGGTCIYSTYGNLDGTGFNPSNARRVTDSDPAGEIHPCLSPESSDLLVYFTAGVGGTFRIYSAKSNDNARSWNDEYWYADNGSTWQEKPTAVWARYDTYVFWEEHLVVGGPTSDIWMGKSASGSTASDIVNISPHREAVYEFNPCADDNWSQIVVMYGGVDIASSYQRMYVKVMDDDPLRFIDYMVAQTTSDYRLRTPSINILNGLKSICAYTTYDPSTYNVFINVCELEIGSAPTSFEVNPLLYMYPAGTVNDSPQGYLYPIVMARDAYYGAGIGVAVWTQFDDGIYESSVMPPRAFGHLDMAQFILDGGYL